MTEKNYTEYERDLRDFEKKPLAKDRETLIFPPESDIKGSDKQDASVLPVAPKLSMRKKAILSEGDAIRVTDPNSYHYGKEGKVTGSQLSQSGDSEVEFTAEFSDASQGSFKETQLQKTFFNKNKGKKISVVSMRKEAVGVDGVQKPESVFEQAVDGHTVQLIFNWESRSEEFNQSVVLYTVYVDDRAIWESNGYQPTDEKGSNDNAEELADAKIIFHDTIERIKKGEFSPEEFKKLEKLEKSKKFSKKIAVNDKILTSSKKKAKVVKVSDDLIFWVSIDGEKDFGSDFAEDIEPFEGHEPHEPFERHRRERGKPVDEGITKEIPMEETIELANKNRRKKKAGNWSLPFTPAAATTLESIISGLQNRNISVSQAQEDLYGAYGDDKLFDDLDELENSISSKAAEVIIGHIRQLLDDYETNPENFKEKLDPEAKEILERI